MSLLTVFVNYFIIPTLASFFLNNFNRFNTYPSRYLWYQVYWPTNLEHLLHGLLPCQLLLMLFSHFLSHRYDALLYTLLASWRLCISFALCISSSQYVCYWPIALVGQMDFRKVLYSYVSCCFSGGLNSGKPWIRLIMTLVLGKLIHLLIMRWAFHSLIIPIFSFIMLFIFIVNVVITMGLIIIFISLFIVLQTVKYFNNEGYETDHYDKYLKSK
jgi:hypothetical protein